MRWAYCFIFVFSGSAAAEPLWYEIETADGRKIGYSNYEVLEGKNGDKGVDTQIMRGSGKRRSERKITRYIDKAGMTHRIELTDKYWRTQSSITADIKNGKAEIVRESKYGRQSYEVSLPENVQFDNGKSLLKAWSFYEEPILEFHIFNIAAESVQRITIKRQQNQNTFLRKTYDGDKLRAMRFFELSDAGDIAKLIQPVLTTEIIKTASTEDTAKRRGPPPGGPAMIGHKSPFKIPSKALNGHIRYGFSFRYETKFQIPETREQKVRVQDGKILIDICASCGEPEMLSPILREEYLRATPWIQSDHSKISPYAAKLRSKGLSDDVIMDRLGRRVRARLKEVDFSGHYSALEAYKKRAGDCTEDAVLLAAMGRAAGIPTRIVSGLVYSREAYHGVSNVFVSHSWVQAWVDGRWKNYDISMGSFDSSHIVLAIGEGDPAMVASPNSLSGFLKLENMMHITSSD